MFCKAPIIAAAAAAAAAAALLGIAGAAAAQPGVPSPVGMWMNPYRSVAVRTGPCGNQQLCGWVIWANDEAKADARDGGTPNLIGTALLRDYRADGEGHWLGTVFVPDHNRSFYSEIDPLSAQAMKVKGCILGGLICKSQIWTRIEEVPHG